MTGETFYEILSDINEAHVKEARKPGKKARRTAWAKWGAAAACLCLVVILPAVLLLSKFQQAETVSGDPADGDSPPGFTLDGKTFYISSHLSVSDELPSGFACGGTVDIEEGMEDCPYYLNPDMPEWVYVYQEILTDGTVSLSGTITRTEPHNAYVRYVDARLRGKNFISYDGCLYISMWHADYYGDTPDVSQAFFDQVRERLGVRIEGEAPEGFISVGAAEFTGYDTIPSGPLSSNANVTEVLADPDDPDVVLAAAQWYSAHGGHQGYDVYIRYDGSLK